MTHKSDFTEDEWQILRWAVSDTILYVSISDPGFWETFSETSAAAKYVANAKTSSESLLVRELAGDLKAGRDKEATKNLGEVAQEVAERIGEAVELVGLKAADDLDAFKAFILGLAAATAEASKDVASSETDAIARIEAALG